MGSGGDTWPQPCFSPLLQLLWATPDMGMAPRGLCPTVQVALFPLWDTAMFPVPLATGAGVGLVCAGAAWEAMPPLLQGQLVPAAGLPSECAGLLNLTG